MTGPLVHGEGLPLLGLQIAPYVSSLENFSDLEPHTLKSQPSGG